MSSEHQQWENIKTNYLTLIEISLAQVDHPKRTEILNNVCEHLDNKYAELHPEQKNWESYQQVITEMGPPEEYAELLIQEKPLVTKKKYGINEFLAVIVVIVLAAVGSYLAIMKTPKLHPQEKPISQRLEFSTGDDIVDKWGAEKIIIGENRCTPDYVLSLLGNPLRIDNDGRMLRYTDDGIDFWFSKNGPLSEVHLNKSYKGRLKSGISLSSTSQDVFSNYGQPVDIIQAANLHRKTDERILHQKGNISRIYYSRHGLIFWFKDDVINQIVVFKGTIFVE